MQVDHKAGDTLSWTCAVTDDGVAVDLTGYTIASQIRTRDGTLLATLTVANRSDAAGAFDVQADASSTAGWMAGSYVCDVQLTDSAGAVQSTTTFAVRVLPDVTGAS